MKWFDLSDEERREWRQHPTTKAFFDSINQQIDEANSEVVTLMADDDEQSTPRARRLAGRSEGLMKAIVTMESDK